MRTNTVAYDCFFSTLAVRVGTDQLQQQAAYAYIIYHYLNKLLQTVLSLQRLWQTPWNIESFTNYWCIHWR